MKSVATFLAVGITVLTMTGLLRSADPPPAGPTSQPATQPVDAKLVADLIAQLGDKDFKVREAATRKLINLGKPVSPILQAKLKDPDPDPEVIDRIKRVLAGIGHSKVYVDQSTAKATLETIARAFRTRDGAAMAQCVPPEYKETMGPVFFETLNLLGKVDSLKKTVEARIGKDAAEKALMGSFPINDGPLPGGINEDGSIDWNKVKLTENDDTATVVVEGKSSGVTLKKINGKWYMDLKDMTPDKAKKDAEQALNMAKAMSAAIVELEKQVKDGTVGKDDLQKAIQGAMVHIMMESRNNIRPNGPPTGPPQ